MPGPDLPTVIKSGRIYYKDRVKKDSQPGSPSVLLFHLPTQAPSSIPSHPSFTADQQTPQQYR